MAEETNNRKNWMKESTEVDPNWMAAYLYYGEPWEDILSNAVKPFCEQIMKEGLADQFFFIRYWEKGPHIRLRFKGDPAKMEKDLKPRIIEYFTNYMEKHPSDRQEPEWLKEADEERQWYPNNRVQFIPYQPEVIRYGGKTGIQVAEQEFMANSKAVLALIDESSGWDYSRALGAAIQLHLGFSYGLGMDLREMKAFFHRFYTNWLPRAYYFFEKDISKDEMEKRKKETLESFDKTWESQKEAITSFFKMVWEAMEEGVEFEQEWLNTWIDDMREVKDNLVQLQKQGSLEPPDWYPHKKPDDFEQADFDRWRIYDSYVHMTNNRLGIQNRDEAYLAYLIKQCLDVMLEEEAVEK
ncbi:thiopeptide-type bacteriocin biosynthesis protein [Roseivirga sp. BDSF3-8]|uniref:thiopeptide-type bacteriocin biosynthesis protein n=1 Tax=Roseivirga sp. BDSF3-8 TaxID=3241598 RepID=UPI0035326D3D